MTNMVDLARGSSPNFVAAPAQGVCLFWRSCPAPVPDKKTIKRVFPRTEVFAC